MLAIASWVRLLSPLASAAVAVLVTSPNTTAADDPAPADPLLVTLPDGWHRECIVTHFSRRWRFAPEPLGDAEEEFTSESGGFDSEELAIALDTPRKELADASGSTLADAVFELARSGYAESGVECTLGTVAPANLLGLYGFAATLTAKDGSTNELFTAELGELVLVSQFTARPKPDPKVRAAGRAILTKGRFDRIPEDVPRSRFSDPHGVCGVSLPSDWYFRGRNENGIGEFLVSPQPIRSDGEVGVGCEIMIWPKYTRAVGDGPLGGTDERVRDGWVVATSNVVARDFVAKATPPRPWPISGMDGRIFDVVRGPKDGPGAYEHRLVVVAARDDTLVSATFFAPELEWPRYAEEFARAAVSLEVYVGKDSVSPLLQNSASNLYGDVLLLGVFVEETLSNDWFPVIDPAPSACVGWQTENSERRLALSVVPGTDAQAYAKAQVSGLPKGWRVTENTFTERSAGLFESAVTVELPNRRSPRSLARIRVMPDDRLVILTATLAPADTEGLESLQPALELLDAPWVETSVAPNLAATVALGRSKVKFTAPKDWKRTDQASRSICGFEGPGGRAWLIVMRPESDRCYSWAALPREALMRSLAGGDEVVLAEKNLSGGKGGQDVERTTLSTKRGSMRIWRKSRTLHRNGVVAILTAEFDLEDAEKPAAAEKRAAPIFTSFKVEGP